MDLIKKIPELDAKIETIFKMDSEYCYTTFAI
jgi:hypothetical protein